MSKCIAARYLICSKKCIKRWTSPGPAVGGSPYALTKAAMQENTLSDSINSQLGALCGGEGGEGMGEQRGIGSIGVATALKTSATLECGD